jgi:hypothetical protein
MLSFWYILFHFVLEHAIIIFHYSSLYSYINIGLIRFSIKALLPDNGSWLLKHVGGNIIYIYIYIYIYMHCMCKYLVFNNIIQYDAVTCPFHKDFVSVTWSGKGTKHEVFIM